MCKNFLSTPVLKPLSTLVHAKLKSAFHKIFSKAILGVLGLGLIFITQTGFQRQKEYCSLFKHCKLSGSHSACPDSLSKPLEDVEYNQTRCSEARYLISKGVGAEDYQGQKLFGFLGQKYRVEYVVKDSLPIKISRFEYLLNDIPLAAKIVNAFRQTKYTAEYLDGEERRYWKGNNGSNLSGEANLIAGSLEEDELIYFGFGIVNVLKWRLRGQVLFQYKYKTPTQGKPIPYNLKVLVFPGGAVVNTIMNMGLFKKVVTNKILDVFNDIVLSAQELSKLKTEQVLKLQDWTPEERVKIKELMNI